MTDALTDDAPDTIEARAKSISSFADYLTRCIEDEHWPDVIETLELLASDVQMALPMADAAETAYFIHKIFKDTTVAGERQPDDGDE